MRHGYVHIPPFNAQNRAKRIRKWRKNRVGRISKFSPSAQISLAVQLSLDELTVLMSSAMLRASHWPPSGLSVRLLRGHELAGKRSLRPAVLDLMS
jgi:hypothetical protein